MQSCLFEKHVEDTFRRSHFCMKSLQTIAHTHRRTRPGDPIGDVCFNILTQVLLAAVHWELEQAGFIDLFQRSVQLDEAVGQKPMFADVSFSDEVAFGILYKKVRQIARLASCALSALYAAGRSSGLSLNFKEDKTEILLSIRGAGIQANQTKALDRGDG